MRIPAGLTLHLVTLHRLIATNNILQRTGNDMVNTRHSVRAWGSLIKYERRFPVPLGYALFKNLVLLPSLQYILLYGGHVQLLIFLVFVHVSGKRVSAQMQKTRLKPHFQQYTLHPKLKIRRKGRKFNITPVHNMGKLNVGIGNAIPTLPP